VFKAVDDPATEKMGTTSAAGEAFMALDLLTIAGLAGSALIVVAYFANQQGLLRAENWRYSLANLVGAVLMLVSLISAWNLPAAIVEGFWALISIYGLLKHGGWLGLR
jgi:Na+-translocating ferredoxin:NAD+ oxidoreductase RnfD subunit